MHRFIRSLLPLLFIHSFCIYAGEVVVPNDTDYQILHSDQLSLLYHQDLQREAEHALSKSRSIEQEYELSFGYQLDESLTIGLLSANNQIANGFSTPIPFNMQMNYIGGAQHIDTFSSPSWLDTLLWHETAHNYQINAKQNKVSQTMHDYLGNNAYPLWLQIIPLFTFPNVTLPTVLLEGNAVLNESTHGNGGRLYNGRAYAMLMASAKAGQITSTRLINNHLDYPYTEEKYLIGGFFWQFLAEQYGMEKVNHFFLSTSSHYLNPFRTNRQFLDHFGITFSDAVQRFIRSIKPDSEQFTPLEGEEIASTKRFQFMGATEQEILFMTEDLKSAPEIYRLGRQSGTIERNEGNWLSGKPFIYQDQLVTAATGYHTPEKILQGLYDNNRHLIKGTADRAYQSISAQTALWFDIPTSFRSPQLIRQDNQNPPELIGEVHSSALLGKDKQSYYFRQLGDIRTLYQNEQPLFSINGYYAIVVEASEQEIWFIASSQYGSSLYRWSEGEITRQSQADNIIDAKQLDNQQWLAACQESDGIHYRLFTPQISGTGAPFERHYAFEQEGRQNANELPTETSQQSEPLAYSTLKETRLSAMTPTLAYDSENGLLFDFQLSFADPLLYHQFILFAQRNNDRDLLAGAQYHNSRNRLEYGTTLYGIARDKELAGARDYGGDLYLQYPLYREGMHFADTTLRFYMSDEQQGKNPTTLQVDYHYAVSRPLQLYAATHHQLTLFAKDDRGDETTGATAALFGALTDNLYLGIDGKYADSNSSSLVDARGIRVSDTLSAYQGDISDFQMLALNDTFYAQKAWQAGGTIRHQFDFSHYFFSFPLSLRREGLYLNAHHYQLSDASQNRYDYNEAVAGITFDLLLLNKFGLPISVEYIYNDSTPEKTKYRLLLTF